MVPCGRIRLAGRGHCWEAARHVWSRRGKNFSEKAGKPRDVLATGRMSRCRRGESRFRPANCERRGVRIAVARRAGCPLGGTHEMDFTPECEKDSDAFFDSLCDRRCGGPRGIRGLDRLSPKPSAAVRSGAHVGRLVAVSAVPVVPATSVVPAVPIGATAVGRGPAGDAASGGVIAAVDARGECAARFDSARFDSARLGATRFGATRFGTAELGAWRDEDRSGGGQSAIGGRSRTWPRG